MLERNHLFGQAECLNCGHEWVAVWPEGCPALECPKCGDNDTVRESGDKTNVTPIQFDRFGAD